MNDQERGGLLAGLIAGLAAATAMLLPVYLLWRFGLRWFMVGGAALFTVCALAADELAETAARMSDCTGGLSCAHSESLARLLNSFADTGWGTLAVGSWIVVATMGLIVDVAPGLARLVNGARAKGS